MGGAFVADVSLRATADDPPAAGPASAGSLETPRPTGRSSLMDHESEDVDQ
ncbi:MULTISPECIES: hypothetical protein [unclassified Mycobacterium]|uniref:hypothetical protein n=1 Tax=unclassified Mycobacterium TaxID=2642494 RepID=UPI0012E96A2A|nr:MULTISPECIES: hypothetical protein [unclassified Mycobacterium]